MVGFIAAAPPGIKTGRAGAIVTGNADSDASKRKALEAVGVVVVDTPSQIVAGLNSGQAAISRH
jgi:succinyl-CoA synthetase alpha subunit